MGNRSVFGKLLIFAKQKLVERLKGLRVEKFSEENN